jgi:RNA polymerase sigma-70 factor (ECF subfamily)
MEKRDFERAVERHRRQVFTLAHYLVSDPSDAEDVAQEVMVRLWRCGGTVEAERLQAWLLRVTRNAAYDRLRRRRTAARFFVGGLESGEAGQARAGSPDPEAKAGAAEFRTLLGSALAGLREPSKSVVILREIQGLSYREISDVMELPLSTVRVALHRGRRRLREDLREVYHHVAAV